MLFLYFIQAVYSADMGFFKFKKNVLNKTLSTINNCEKYKKQKLEVAKKYDDFLYCLQNSFIDMTSYSLGYHYPEYFEINDATILEYILYMCYKCNKYASDYIYQLYNRFLTVRIFLLDKQIALLKKKNYDYNNLKSDLRLAQDKKLFERLKLELKQNPIVNDFYDIKVDFTGTLKKINDDYSDLFNEEYYLDVKAIYARYAKFISSLLVVNKILLTRFYNQLNHE